MLTFCKLNIAVLCNILVKFIVSFFFNFYFYFYYYCFFLFPGISSRYMTGDLNFMFTKKKRIIGIWCSVVKVLWSCMFTYLVIPLFAEHGIIITYAA